MYLRSNHAFQTDWRLCRKEQFLRFQILAAGHIPLGPFSDNDPASIWNPLPMMIVHYMWQSCYINSLTYIIIYIVLAYLELLIQMIYLY